MSNSVSLENIFQKSIIEKEFMRYINNPEIKIISFDVFDTLVFRKCDLPTTAFDIMGEDDFIKHYFDTPNAFKEYRIMAEKTARKTYKELEDITFGQIYEEMFKDKEYQEKLQKLELDIENKLLVPNYQLDRWIEIAHQNNKKVVLVSDMYLSSTNIMDIAVSKLKNFSKIDKIYVSSEYKKTKGTGNLFFEVAKDFDIELEEILHIGDNKKSDYVLPQTFGINTLYYGFNDEQKQSFDYENSYIKQHLFNGNHIRRLGILTNPYENDDKNFYYNFGLSIFGPLLWEFSHWLKNIIDRFGLTQANFIMREGFIFKKYFNLLYPEIETNLIYASRKSTNPFYVEIDDIGSISAEKHRAFTVQDLYTSFLISIDDDIINQYSDMLLENTQDIYIKDNITLFNYILSNLDTRHQEIKNVNSTQKEMIKEYFKSFNIKKNSMFVDFGAGGTIFNRFSDILGDGLPMLNVLFFENERGYWQQVNAHTLSFLPYTKDTANGIEVISKSPEFIEVLLNLNMQTTTSYREENGKIIPNTYLPNCNLSLIEELTKSFIDGIDSFFTLAKAYELAPQTYPRDWLLHMLARTIELPSEREVRKLGFFEYDEGRGTDYVYRIIDDEKINEIKQIGIEKAYYNYLQNRTKFRFSYPWFEGILTIIDSDYLISFYRKISKESTNEKVVRTLVSKIKSSNEKNIMIYGAGDIFMELYIYLQELGINIIKVMDTRAEIREFIVYGHRITTIDKAFKKIDSATIVIASGAFVEKIDEKIKYFSNINNKTINTIKI